jgi:RNA polymerase sigma factor (sigma-70 family)
VEDAALVRDCLADRPEAVRMLIERFRDDIHGLCFRLLNHRQDAEDVTQEVFVRIFRSLKSWDSSRPLRPWIFTIAVNRCRTWLSRRGRRPESVDFLHEVPARPEADEAVELTREIQTALDELRPDYRIVFVMFHQQGLSYEDIAAAVGRPVGTVKTWLHRTRADLLERLRRRGMVEDYEPSRENISPRTEP